MTILIDWDGLRDHLGGIPWEDIFKLDASAAAREFCEWVQVGINVYIPHQKYHVKPHSSPWLSGASADAIINRNHLLGFYQQNKSSESKEKLQLKLPNLHMLIKHKSLLLTRNLALGTFGNLLIVFSKGKSAIPPLFNSPEVLPSTSNKAKLFA